LWQPRLERIALDLTRIAKFQSTQRYVITVTILRVIVAGRVAIFCRIPPAL
jgi:hypothetical protein